MLHTVQQLRTIAKSKTRQYSTEGFMEMADEFGELLKLDTKAEKSLEHLIKASQHLPSTLELEAKLKVMRREIQLLEEAIKLCNQIACSWLQNEHFSQLSMITGRVFIAYMFIYSIYFHNIYYIQNLHHCYYYCYYCCYDRYCHYYLNHHRHHHL